MYIQSVANHRTGGGAGEEYDKARWLSLRLRSSVTEAASDWRVMEERAGHLAFLIQSFDRLLKYFDCCWNPHTSVPAPERIAFVKLEFFMFTRFR